MLLPGDRLMYAEFRFPALGRSNGLANGHDFRPFALLAPSRLQRRAKWARGRAGKRQNEKCKRQNQNAPRTSFPSSSLGTSAGSQAGAWERVVGHFAIPPSHFTDFARR